MGQERRQRRPLVVGGAAALAIMAVSLIVIAINKKRRKSDLPGLSIRISLTPSEILKLADQIIMKSKDIHDAVASLPGDKVTYMNTVLRLAELEAQQFALVQSCVFQKMLSPSDDVRKASAEAEKNLDAHLLSCRKRADVYYNIKSFSSRGERLSPESRHYISCLVRSFERNGMHLIFSKREEVDSLRAQIDELSLRFIKNLSEDKSFLLLCESELAGLPQEFIKSLDRGECGRVKITLRSHHVLPILEYCKVGETRKLVAVAQGQRCGEDNLHILENLVKLRHKFARSLGYSNYAEYIVEPRMAKSPNQVFDFLEELSARLTELAARELHFLKELKKKEEGESSFGVEDLHYYLKRAEEMKLDLDMALVKEYFPLNFVLGGIIKIFEDLFGLRFDEVLDAEVWHEDVQLFSAVDIGSCELVGYFYLDLFSRDGKGGHTCIIALQNGCVLSNGVRQVPVAVLVSQIHKLLDGSPCLLHFSMVVSLFHEFSHVIHHICNRASFARFSGIQMQPDFLEIFGHLLENWCYEHGHLQMLSGFHQDLSKHIPDEVCQMLKRSRDSFSTLKLKQEILLCLFDQIIHSSENVDMMELLKYLHPKVMLGIPLLEGTRLPSCFLHSAVLCDATCYSQLWSEAFAADIFASKFKDVHEGHYTGMQLREKVLAPGGAKDPMGILYDFLGRKPSLQAFIERKTCNCV